jgi:serine kinase of HPr protein (carbohydrate metabolism regulator)
MRAAPSRSRGAHDIVTLHATTVAVDGVGVLLRGPSGSGKSDLALRLIDGGAALVSDDRTQLGRDGAGLLAQMPRAAPPSLRGRMEVRGLGIMAVPFVLQARLGLVVELAPDAPIERLPDAQTCDYLGVAVPLIVLRAFEASAPAKLRLAARALGGAAESAA